MTIVLTDLGMVCALGDNTDAIFTAAVSGSLAGMHTFDDYVPNQSVVFGSVSTPLPRVDMRCYSLLLQALKQIKPTINRLKTEYDSNRIGVVLGTSNTGIEEAQRHIETTLKNQPTLSDFDFTQIELGTPALFLRDTIGVKGPAYSVSTACSSAAKAFQSARQLIQNDVCDAVIVGGVDALCCFAMNGFRALEALSPTQTNPMSPNRQGINLGEGAALFCMEKDKTGIVLCGIGESSDAYHLTSPHPEGRGAFQSMQQALDDAGLSPDKIDYINLHGTGTLHNDSMESRAVYDLFGDKPLCASTKPMTGHALGASGAIELGLCYLMLKHGQTIPHVFDGVWDSSLSPIRLATSSKKKNLSYILSNSFAFGGSNASLIIGVSHDL